MIFKPKELKVVENENHLNITYSWFDASAFPMFLLSIVQICFAAFIFIGRYSSVTIAASIFFMILAIILLYQAITKIFNRTIIDVNVGKLSIAHKPIPWIRGNTKLNQEEIKQFYVKEKKGDSSRAYDLRVVLNKGTDMSVLAINATDSHLILQLEDRLEQFMGIEDEPVKGEYGKTKEYYEQKANKPKQKRKTKAQNNFYYDLEIGTALSVKNNWLTVNHAIQYDWKTGNTDKQFQLISRDGEENLLYVRKKGKLYASYVEHELTEAELEELDFSPYSPASKLIMDERQFLQTALLEGDQFLSDDSKPIDVKQWIYTTSDSELQIRILKTEINLTIHKGKIIPDYYFQDTTGDELELRDLEENKEILLKEENSGEESDNPWDELF